MCPSLAEGETQGRPLADLGKANKCEGNRRVEMITSVSRPHENEIIVRLARVANFKWLRVRFVISVFDSFFLSSLPLFVSSRFENSGGREVHREKRLSLPSPPRTRRRIREEKRRDIDFDPRELIHLDTSEVETRACCARSTRDSENPAAVCSATQRY